MNHLIQEVIYSEAWENYIKPALDKQLSRAHDDVHISIRDKNVDLGNLRYSQGYYDGIQSVVSLIKRLAES